MLGIEWIPNNQFSITIHGPQQSCYDGYLTDVCAQQGIQIIDHFKFYDPNNPHDAIYTVWDERRWVNGYNENNVSGGRDADVDDCDQCNMLYEGDVEFAQIYNYNFTNYLSPGQNVLL